MSSFPQCIATYLEFFIRKKQTLSYIMLKNGQTCLKKSSRVHSARFLKYVGPFSNIMLEKGKHTS